MLVMTGILAILARPALAQQMPLQPNAIRSQLSQAAPGKQAAPAAAAVQNTSAPAAPAQAAPKAGTPAVPAASGPRRDPFDPLLNRSSGSGTPGPDRLPPGKAGLMIGTLRVDGLVHGPNGMIAVISNPQQRVYFLREGDRIFDGQVTRITMEAISFQQSGRDAFGNPLEHEVTRRLYPNPGEQR
jgi:hypothetical protein